MSDRPSVYSIEPSDFTIMADGLLHLYLYILISRPAFTDIRYMWAAANKLEPVLNQFEKPRRLLSTMINAIGAYSMIEQHTNKPVTESIPDHKTSRVLTASSDERRKAEAICCTLPSGAINTNINQISKESQTP